MDDVMRQIAKDTKRPWGLRSQAGVVLRQRRTNVDGAAFDEGHTVHDFEKRTMVVSNATVVVDKSCSCNRSSDLETQLEGAVAVRACGGSKNEKQNQRLRTNERCLNRHTQQHYVSRFLLRGFHRTGKKVYRKVPAFVPNRWVLPLLNFR